MYTYQYITSSSSPLFVYTCVDLLLLLLNRNSSSVNTLVYTFVKYRQFLVELQYYPYVRKLVLIWYCHPRHRTTWKISKLQLICLVVFVDPRANQTNCNCNKQTNKPLTVGRAFYSFYFRSVSRCACNIDSVLRVQTSCRCKT